MLSSTLVSSCWPAVSFSWIVGLFLGREAPLARTLQSPPDEDVHEALVKERLPPLWLTSLTAADVEPEPEVLEAELCQANRRATSRAPSH